MSKSIGGIFLNLLLLSETGNPVIDDIIWNKSNILRVIAIAALLVFILINPELRKRKRPEDRIIFSECILALLLLLTDLFYNLSFLSEYNLKYYVTPSVIEFLYLMTVLRWVIFVDYSLFHSPDHVKRRYTHAVLPVCIVMSADLFQSFLYYGTDGDRNIIMRIGDVLQVCKMAVALYFIITAVRLVTVHGREFREPKFIRLSAFIVPFILGCLFRFFASSFMALGIILTYGAVKRRDRFLDRDTLFYSRDFLSYVSKYRDYKEYAGGCGILIRAAGHGQDMAGVLRESIPADINVYALGNDSFLLLTEAVRGSAVRMISMTITDAAESSEDPYTPEIITERRGEEESAAAFAERLLNMG